MKITNTKNHKKNIAISLIVVSLLLVAGLTYAWWWKSKDTQPQNTEDTSVGVNNDSDTISEDQIDNENDESGTLPPKPGEDENVNTPQTGDTSSNGVPEKPSLDRHRQSGGNIKVVAIFTKQSPGYCKLTLKKSGQQSITKTADITVGPSYYSCSFSIPSASMPSSGIWAATVAHHIGSNSTNSQTKDIEVSK